LQSRAPPHRATRLSLPGIACRSRRRPGPHGEATPQTYIAVRALARVRTRPVDALAVVGLQLIATLIDLVERPISMRRLAWLLALGRWRRACAVPLDPPPSGAPAGDEPPRSGGSCGSVDAEDPRYLDPARGTTSSPGPSSRCSSTRWSSTTRERTIVPGRAETWTTSPDGRHLSFRLRTTSSTTGRPFTAADVKFSLERLLKPSIHSQGASSSRPRGRADYIAGAAKEVRGIRVPAPDGVEST